MNRTLKIFIACALGAFVGTLVTLELNKYLWWVGLIVGGIFGYLSYEFNKIREAIVESWHQVPDVYHKALNRCSKVFSKLSTVKFWKDWAVFFMGCFFLFLIVIGLMFGFLVLMSWDGIVQSHTSSISTQSAGSELMEFLGMFFIIVFVMALIVSLISIKEGPDAPFLSIKESKWVAIHLNPFTLFIYYPLFGLVLVIRKIILESIPLIIEKTPTAMKKFKLNVLKFFLDVWLFIKRIFISIHSDHRLLCAIDAGIGTAIGYFFHSALIGALAGGIFGVINYEIVSKRILHLPVCKEITP